MTKPRKRKAPTKAPPIGDEPPTVPSGRGVVLPPDSKPKRTATTEARIEQAAAAMRAGTFARGKTVRRLAEAWGVALDTAKGYTAEASRRVRSELDEFAKAEARDYCLVNAQRIVRDSMREARDAAEGRLMVQKVGPQGREYTVRYDPSIPRRTALAALDHIRALTGAGAPTRIDVTTEGLRLPDDPAERAKIYEALAERERSRAGGA